MKRIVLSLFCVFLVSCTTWKEQFVQGSIEIALPVRQEVKPDGSVVFSTFNDGGTAMFRITDAKQRQYDVYLDRRLILKNGVYEKTPDVIFLNAYPDSNGSVMIIDQNRFRNTVLRNLVLPSGG